MAGDNKRGSRPAVKVKNIDEATTFVEQNNNNLGQEVPQRPQEQLNKLPKEVFNKLKNLQSRTEELAFKGYEINLQESRIKKMQENLDKRKEEYFIELASHDVAENNFKNEVTKNCGGAIEVLDDEGTFRVIQNKQ